jgi:hypothetical protein
MQDKSWIVKGWDGPLAPSVTVSSDVFDMKTPAIACAIACDRLIEGFIEAKKSNPSLSNVE